MSYSSQTGRRPNEYASKSSHSNIIWDQKIKKFLDKCKLPGISDEIDLREENLITDIDYNIKSPISLFITIDGGYTEVSIRKEFPSCTLNFFQFGALMFELKDLKNLSVKSFIDPEDIEKLKK
ncbi:MAG: hypothetical protein NHB15_18940 [Methanosarcina barkeri]|nr:hypothetical protein [Methanosarcina sp. ERenArc_MAG2]